MSWGGGGIEGKTPPDVDGGLLPSALALNRCNMAIREGEGGGIIRQVADFGFR